MRLYFCILRIKGINENVYNAEFSSTCHSSSGSSKTNSCSSDLEMLGCSTREQTKY